MAVKKVKKTVKKSSPSAAKSAPKRKVTSVHIHREHEFIIITGGGFIVAVLAMVLFF